MIPPTLITPKLPLQIEDSKPSLFENIIVTDTDTHTPLYFQAH